MPMPKSCIVCFRTTPDGASRCPKHADRGHRLPRGCIVCGTATMNGDYCDDHELEAQAASKRRQTYRSYSSATYRKNRPIALRRARGRCEICDQPERPDDPLEVDHIRETSRGGNDELDNLRAAHRSCNNKRRRGRPQPSRARGRAR